MWSPEGFPWSCRSVHEGTQCLAVIRNAWQGYDESWILLWHLSADSPASSLSGNCLHIVLHIASFHLQGLPSHLLSSSRMCMSLLSSSSLLLFCSVIFCSINSLFILPSRLLGAYLIPSLLALSLFSIPPYLTHHSSPIPSAFRCMLTVRNCGRWVLRTLSEKLISWRCNKWKHCLPSLSFYQNQSEKLTDSCHEVTDSVIIIRMIVGVENHSFFSTVRFWTSGPAPLLILMALLLYSFTSISYDISILLSLSHRLWRQSQGRTEWRYVGPYSMGSRMMERASYRAGWRRGGAQVSAAFISSILLWSICVPAFFSHQSVQCLPFFPH